MVTVKALFTNRIMKFLSCITACMMLIFGGIGAANAHHFTVTTTNQSSSSWTFKFNMSANGTFTVDCGANGTLGCDAKPCGTISGNTITRTSTTNGRYKCTYTSGGAKTIAFDRVSVTGYSSLSTTDSSSAINFYTSATPTLIASIDGDLSALFPQLSETGDGNIPMFYFTFAGATNLTSIPSTLFSGYTRGRQKMFYFTFENCTGLTSAGLPGNLFFPNAESVNGQECMFDTTFRGCTGLTYIPENLFSKITSGAKSMFQRTFSGCTGLTSAGIPSNLFFPNAQSVSGASYMFNGTFSGCTGLTTIPSDLFSKITSGANYMFNGTFYGCTGLTSIPENLFAKVTTSADYMFAYTFSGCTGLTSAGIPSDLFFPNAQSVSGAEGMYSTTFNGCTGLTYIPENLFSKITSGASDMFKQTFNNCTNLGCATKGCSTGTGYIPATLFAGITPRGDNATNTMSNTFNNTKLVTTCPTGTTQYITGWEGSSTWNNKVSCISAVSHNITYVMDGGDNYSNAPATYNEGTGATIDGIPTKSGYTFAGWCTDSNLTSCAFSQTIGTEATGNKTFYAKWCADCNPTNANCTLSTVGNTCTYTTSCAEGYGNIQNDGAYNASCSEGGHHFTVTTTNQSSGFWIFKFNMSANGTFTVNCGADGTLGCDSGTCGTISGNTITRTNTTNGLYKCTYTSGGAKTISFGRVSVTGYNTGTYDTHSAINFYTNATPTLIASIDGDLSALFPQLSETGNIPMFQMSFRGATNLTSIPSTLFSGYTRGRQWMFAGTFYGCTGLKSAGLPGNLFFPNAQSVFGAVYMFAATFQGCTGLTYIPENLFAKVTTSATSMFNATFYGCTGLTSAGIPSNLFFPNVQSVSGAEAMFRQTFKGCTGLTYIPENLFSKITSGAENMFKTTFSGCSSLGCATNGCSTGTGYIPSTLFAGITPRGDNAANTMSNTFENTKLVTTCPAGTTYYETGWEGSSKWNGKVSCIPDVSHNITYVMDGGTNYNGAPTTYGEGVGTTISGIPTKSGYVFAGWCTDSGLQTCAMSQTIGTSATTDQTFYAKWTQCQACSGNTGATCTLSVVNNVCTYTTSCNSGYDNIQNNGAYNASCSEVVANSYDITYTMNGGTNYSGAPETYVEGVGTTISGTPTKSGNTFAGWCTDSNLTSCAFSQTIGTEATGNKTFYAKWCADCNPTNANCTLSTAGNTCTYTTSCNEGYYGLTNNGAYNASCSACGGNNYYCTNGIQNTVASGYYSTGGTETTRTGTAQCVSGEYCVNGVKNDCPSGYGNSVTGATAQNQCYRACTTANIEHSATVTGNDYYGDGEDTCSAETCATGYNASALSVWGAAIDTSTNCVAYADINYYGETSGNISDYNFTNSDASVWGASFEWGKVRGSSDCWGGNCRCRLMGYQAVGSSEWQDVSSSTSWVQVWTTDPDYCADGCSDTCLGKVCTNTNVRNSMLAGTQKICVPATYNITYTMNGGTNYSGAPTTYTYGTGATINGTPTREGYTFAGWCTDSNLTSCSSSQTIGTDATGDKTFYAKWTQCQACSGNTGATCSLSVSNNTCTYATACESGYDNIQNNGAYNASCSESNHHFTVTTTNQSSSDWTFKFNMSANGTFTVNCGADGTLGCDSGTCGTISGNTITRTNTTNGLYKCTYTSGGAKTISFGRVSVTGYSAGTSATNSAINFYSSATPTLIASIDGDLSALFPQLSATGDGNIPMFQMSFDGATNLTSIPSTLFSGYTRGRKYMFGATFHGCTGLTSAGIPSDLFFPNAESVDGQQRMFSGTFSGCTGLTSLPNGLFFPNAQSVSGAEEMFYGTFRECTGLTTLPNGLFFPNVTNGVSGAEEMFCYTFYGCTGLTTLPSDLFSKITSGAHYMFAQTFYGCSNLGCETAGCSSGTRYIPATLFAGITPRGDNATDTMSNTFQSTKLVTTCPDGTIQYTTGWESYWYGNKKSCIPNASHNITYVMDGGTNYSGAPTTYGEGVGATIDGIPTKSGYVFAGWCTDSGLNTCAMTQTIGTDATTDQTFYAKWTQCQACAATNASCSLSVVNNVCTYTTSCNAGYGNIQNNGAYNASCSACEPCAATNASCSVSTVNNVCIYTTSCNAGYGAIQNEGAYNVSCSEVETFGVTYECGDGATGTAPTDTTDYESGTSVTTKPNSCSKINSTFTGWTCGGTNVNAGSTFTISANTTCTARWNECTACAGNTGVTCSVSVSNNTCTYTTSCNTGYGNITGNGTANASCTPNSYNITYDLTGGESCSDLPSGYTEVEYLYSNGSQWIDSGVHFLFGDEFFFDYMQMQDSGNREAKGYGAGVSGAPYQINGGGRRINQSDTRIVFNAGNQYVYSPTLYFENTLGRRYTEHWIMDTSTRRINSTITDLQSGATYTASTQTYPTNYDSNQNNYLFRDSHPTAPHPAKIRIYGTWLKRSNGNLASNLIPARRNSDNVLGMYDTVSKTFKTNSGSGTFTAGPDVVSTACGTNYSGAPTTYTYGTGATINGTPTREGYTFAGWCTNSNLTSCSSSQTIGTDATGDKTFYAKWNEASANSYTISYTMNGGTNYSGAPETYVEGVGTTISGTPTKSGNTFAGWCTDSNLTSCANSQTIGTEATGNKTFYAKWCADCNPTNANCTLSTAGNTCTYTTSCNEGYYGLTNNGAYNASCSACGGNNYYCTNGIQNTVASGYYSTGGTETTRTGTAQCVSGEYCVNGVKNDCPSGYGNSVTGATAQNQCYRACTTANIEHSATVTGNDYYGDSEDTCSAETCATGYNASALSVWGAAIDTSTNGIRSAYIDDFGETGGNISDYNLTENGAWGVLFEWGKVRGSSDIRGVGNGNCDCKCRLTDYQTVGSSEWQDVSSSTSWVKVSTRSCDYAQEDCASDCVVGLYDNPNLRNSMLAGTQKICVPATYNITYTMNGGTNYSGAPTTYTYGTGATINGTPTREGYTFAGWCTDSVLTSCAMSQTIGTSATTDQTFYAKWTQCTPCSGNTGATCSLSVSNNTCTYATACESGYDNIQNNGAYNASCSESNHHFTVTTTNQSSSDWTFKFNMSANGTFTVNCGADGTLGCDGGECGTISGNTITRTNTTNGRYKCTYTSGGAKTISFGRVSVTGYSAGTSATNSAINFYSSATPTLIASIDGDLSALFPQLSATGDGNIPMFRSSFKGATNLTSIPATLFADYTTASIGMFYDTFCGCTGLTSAGIPSNLFFPNAQSVSGAKYMFFGTFRGCTGLTTLPNGLFFPNVTNGVSGAEEMFCYTFYGCTGLTTLPSDLFSKITSGAHYMFAQTFYGCSNLGCETAGCSTGTGYIPATLFAGITPRGSNATNTMSNTFQNTKLVETCPAGTTQYITGWEGSGTWNSKVSCISGVSHNITYVMDGGDNYSNAPATYYEGTGATIDGIPTKSGYVFAGWCTDSGLNSCAMTQTIGTDATTDQTFYAKWTQCTACSGNTGATCTLSVVNNVCTYATSCNNEYSTIQNSGQYNASCTECTPCAATNASCSVSVSNNTCVYTTSCNSGYVNIQNNGAYNASCSANSNTGSGNAPIDANEYSAGATVTTVSGEDNTCTKEGHTFAGWNCGGTEVEAGSTFTINANTTCTARWNACPVCNATNASCSLSVVDNTCTYTTTCNDGYGDMVGNGTATASCSCNLSGFDVTPLASINRTDYGYITNDGTTRSTSVYGITQAGTWGISFDTQQVRGLARCSNTNDGKLIGQTGNPGTATSGGKCWCKVTEYRADSSSAWQTALWGCASSEWVLLSDGNADMCRTNCAAYCSSTSLRSVILGQ